MREFLPEGSNGTNVSLGASVRLTLPTYDVVDGVARVAVASSTAGAAAAVAFGDSSVVAAGTDAIVCAGVYEIFRIPAGATHVSVFGVIGSAAVSVTVGRK